jgi:hypothetical protein
MSVLTEVNSLSCTSVVFGRNICSGISLSWDDNISFRSKKYRYESSAKSILGLVRSVCKSQSCYIIYDSIRVTAISAVPAASAIASDTALTRAELAYLGSDGTIVASAPFTEIVLLVASITKGLATLGVCTRKQVQTHQHPNPLSILNISGRLSWKRIRRPPKAETGMT